MAARRLIIVLVVLFAISIAAAAVAPQRESSIPADEETTTSSTDPGPEPEPAAASGGSVTEAIEAEAGEPPTVRTTVGDQLELSVSARAPLQVELPALGLLEEATPEAPALFDILLREPGDFPITDGAGGEVIGRLLVAEAGVTDEAPNGEGAQPGTVGSQDGERSGSR